MAKLRDFFKTGLEGSPFLKEALSEFDYFDPGSDRFLGFPVRQVEIEDGEREITDLVSLDRGTVDPKVFEVGKNFPKKTPFGMQP